MKNRRKRLTIPQEFRNRLILPLCIILIGFNFVIFSNILIANNSLPNRFQPETIFLIGILELILVFWVLFSGALTAHRMAGPMIALEKGFTSLGAGDLTTTVQFRQHDLNQNVAHSFNENVECLRQQVLNIKELTEKLEQQLPENHSSQELLKQLQQELDYLNT
jgi:methyl-accepting chemotaxis protein